MKVTYHIPTEQYGFIEVVDDSDISMEQVGHYEDVKASVMPKTVPVKPEIPSGGGIDDKEWNGVLDGYVPKIEIGSMRPDSHERMSPKQQWFIHELDKLSNRKAYKNN